MKRYWILLILVMSQLSCENLLEKDPLATLSVVSGYKTESDAMKALSAAYNPLYNYPGYDGYSIYDMVTDNALKGGEGPSDGSYFNDIANFTISSTNTVALQVWKNSYLGIFRTHLVLENVPGIEMDETAKSRIIAEARFLRAYYYFTLVTLFGDVPLIKTSVVKVPEVVRDPKAAVYDFIVEDFTAAIAVLPARSALPAAENGRITKGAAQAYLGKVYLYKSDFVNAEKWFKAVIDSKEYRLADDYASLFTLAGEFGPENIFEINHVYSAQYLVARNLGSIRQGSAGMYGYGFCNPSQDLVDEFEAGDPRLWQTVYKQGDKMPDGKTADVGNSETGYMSKKAYLLAPDFPPTGDPIHSARNEIKLRYGMLLLWYAEAANENGNSTAAVSSLNEVRRRARQGKSGVLPDVAAAGQEQLRNAIYHEQRVEYALENHRFFDLVRQGRAGKVLRAYAEKYKTVKGKNFREGINEVLPIPQSEIDDSQKRLSQNNGY
ncbi:RagB/SusD family nutrient uptake outer membrane protein [Ravibacter arvi]|uniref:RagB/SusD family nutrient uptake outer membrane protein n=1 Tax=Ravibacter arvi TaxID=2051041 RepID=A0ABP8LKN9_9BACT